MYKKDLALNNLQRLICHKTQQFDNYELNNVLCHVKRNRISH